MQASFRYSFLAAGLALAGASGLAQADLVIHFSTDHYVRSGLANNGLPGGDPPDANAYPNDPWADRLDLSGTAATELTLLAGIPQIVPINLLTFTAGTTGSGTAGPDPDGPGVDYSFFTSQLLFVQEAVSNDTQDIAQPFNLNVGWSGDTLALENSPVLTFDLGSGNVLTFRALASQDYYWDGSNPTEGGMVSGEFLLTVVPLPPAAWAALSTMLGIAGVGIIRRRRHTA